MDLRLLGKDFITLSSNNGFSVGIAGVFPDWHCINTHLNFLLNKYQHFILRPANDQAEGLPSFYNECMLAVGE